MKGSEDQHHSYAVWGSHMKILIADDKPQIRRLLRGLLESHEGWSVCAEAEDGVQAVGLAQQFKPDVIVLDLAMPGLNGLDAARQISNLFPGVPLIMHTLYAYQQMEIEAKKCGIRTVTSKPDGGALVKAIEAAVADVRVAHEAPTILGEFPPKAA